MQISETTIHKENEKNNKKYAKAKDQPETYLGSFAKVNQIVPNLLGDSLSDGRIKT